MTRDTYNALTAIADALDRFGERVERSIAGLRGRLDDLESSVVISHAETRGDSQALAKSLELLRGDLSLHQKMLEQLNVYAQKIVSDSEESERPTLPPLLRAVDGE